MRHHRLQVHKHATAERGSAEAELAKLTFIVLFVLFFLFFFIRGNSLKYSRSAALQKPCQTKG